MQVPDQSFSTWKHQKQRNHQFYPRQQVHMAAPKRTITSMSPTSPHSGITNNTYLEIKGRLFREPSNDKVYQLASLLIPSSAVWQIVRSMKGIDIILVDDVQTAIDFANCNNIKIDQISLDAALTASNKTHSKADIISAGFCRQVSSKYVPEVINKLIRAKSFGHGHGQYHKIGYIIWECEGFVLFLLPFLYL